MNEHGSPTASNDPEGSIFLPSEVLTALDEIRSAHDAHKADLCNLLGRGAFTGLAFSQQVEVNRRLLAHHDRLAS